MSFHIAFTMMRSVSKLVLEFFTVELRKRHERYGVGLVFEFLAAYMREGKGLSC